MEPVNPSGSSSSSELDLLMKEIETEQRNLRQLVDGNFSIKAKIKAILERVSNASAVEPLSFWRRNLETVCLHFCSNFMLILGKQTGCSVCIGASIGAGNKHTCGTRVLSLWISNSQK